MKTSDEMLDNRGRGQNIHVKNQVGRFLDSLRRIRREVWRFALCEILAGIILLFAYHAGTAIAQWDLKNITIENYPFMTRVILDVLRDLGVGFFVAAAAGIGFEGLHQSVGDAAKELEIQQKIDALIDVAEKMKHFANPLLAVSNHLDAVFPDNKYRKIKENINEMIKVMAEMRSHDKECCPGLEGVEYVALVDWMLNEYVLSGAKDLVHLMRALNPKEMDYCASYEPPDRKSLAQRIFAAQMRSMKCDDEYRSLTNLRLYEGGDAKIFIDATKDALQKGVSIRRIFNVCELEVDNSPMLSWATVCKMICDQMSLFSHDKFQARVLRVREAASVDREIAYGCKLPNSDAVKNLYFGIFVHNQGGVVVFRASPTDITKLSLDAYQNLNKVKPTMDLFEHLWSMACPVVDFIEENKEFMRDGVSVGRVPHFPISD